MQWGRVVILVQVGIQVRASQGTLDIAAHQDIRVTQELAVTLVRA